MIAWRMHAFGRVQGVWYRSSTQKQAWHLGLKGWVRNLPDGTVEVHAEGEAADLEQLFNWMYQGPPLAKVTKVEKEVVEVEGFNDFSVSY